MLILQPGIGVSSHRVASREDKNRDRRNQDSTQRNDLLNQLNNPTEVANSDTLTVLVQPNPSDAYLYLESLKDAIAAMAGIANRRTVMSGEQVVKIFDGMAPILRDVRELADRSRSLDKVFAEYTNRWETPVTKATTHRSAALVAATIAAMIAAICPFAMAGVVIATGAAEAGAIGVASAAGFGLGYTVGRAIDAHDMLEECKEQKRRLVGQSTPDP
jgi:hypothetical protein